MTDSTSTSASSISGSAGGGNAGGGGWSRLVRSVQSGIAQKQQQARLAKEAREVGKIYNPSTKRWEFYLLDEEWNELQVHQQQQQQQQQQQHKFGSQESNMSAASTSATGVGDSTNERIVADREYYDLLHVSTNADSATIKRAYYKVARKYHPDKNPNDPDAHTKFQEIGHAYQILSNETTRALYDKNGKSANTAEEGAAASIQEVDPLFFFNVMFGSSLVEPYIGELWLASQTDSILKDSTMQQAMMEERQSDDDDNNNRNQDHTSGQHSDQDDDDSDEEERKRRQAMEERLQTLKEKNELQQKIRVVKIARNLRSRIESYDPSQPNIFAEDCREEAGRIVAGAYGDLYCVTIGFALKVAAQEYLGFETTLFGIGGHLARTKKNASGFATNMKLVGAGIRAASAGSRAMREAQEMEQQRAAKEAAAEKDENTGYEDDSSSSFDDTKAQEQMANTLDESLPAFLEFAWAINKRDIQSTLKTACRKLFDDASVPKEMRMERARAIEILGHEFESVGKQHQAAAAATRDGASSSSKHYLDPEDVKARVAVATMATMAKAQGQEVTEQDQEDMMQQAKQMSMEQKTGGRGGGGGESSK